MKTPTQEPSTILDGTGIALVTPASDSSGGAPPTQEAPWVPALGIVWARRGIEHIGECFLVESGEPTGRIIGRRSTADPMRLLPLRQRPGGGRFAAELDEPGMSRRQLRVRRVGAEGVELTNIGRRLCRVNGEELLRDQSVILAPGALVEVDRQLLLAMHLRPGVMAAMVEGSPPAFPFAGPDALGLVGESPAMWALRSQVSSVASMGGEHVLIDGPSGSGKEQVASGLHALSPRRAQPLISRSVVSIPESLMDAELFGNVAGFPNPGMRAHAGLVGEADGGTLFLDEVGEIGHELQARLLRVMDGGEYTPLGAARPRQADVRVVAATNRDPHSLKHDFLARFPLRIHTLGLGQLWIDIPLIARKVLREIVDAGLPNLERFLPRASADGLPRMSVGMVCSLLRFPYRTHVRELRQLLHASLSQSAGPWVEPCDDLRNSEVGSGSVPRVVASETARLPPAEGSVFTPDEQRRLQLQRRYAFDAAACGEADDYPTNRQNASLTLNVLMAKALRACEWQVEAAVCLLSGLREGDAAALGDPGHRRVRRRMRAFISHQQMASSSAPTQSASPPTDLRRYGAYSSDVLEVRRALADGRLRLA